MRDDRLQDQPPHRTRARRGLGRGFTLFELVVVVVIIAILAATVVPRLSGTTRQEAGLAIDRVGELMRLFAYRHALSAQQVALWRDGQTGRIELLVMDRDPQDPDAAPAWRTDRFASSVELPTHVVLEDVRVDDKRLATDEWLVPSIPGGTRPKIELHIVGDGVDSTLVLPSNSPSVVRVDAGQPDPFVRTPIDLNRAGRDRQSW